MARCTSCGSQLVKGAKFCSDCGTTQTVATDSQDAFALGQTESITRALKKRKPFYKKWWFWLVSVIALFVVITAVEDITYVADEFHLENYKKVETIFKDSGFRNIELVEIEADYESRSDEVDEVTVGGQKVKNIAEATAIGKDAKVSIYYYSYAGSDDSALLPASVIRFSGKEYELIEEELLSAGFSNVETKPVYDVTMDTVDEDGLVATITVDGSETFDAQQRYPKDTAIVVTYHSVIEMPMSGEEFDLGDYQTAVNELTNAGFSNIKIIGLGDLIISLLHDEGDVRDITVDGVAGFADGGRYPKDVPILITYHSYEASEEYAVQPDESATETTVAATTTTSPIDAVLAPLQEEIFSIAATTTTAATTIAPTATSAKSVSTTTTAKPTTRPTTTKATTTTTRTAAPKKPPANQDVIVYWGQSGDKVHRSENCRTFKYTPYSGTIAQANAAGHYGWCGVCS